MQNRHSLTSTHFDCGKQQPNNPKTHRRAETAALEKKHVHWNSSAADFLLRKQKLKTSKTLAHN
jgi:hypothetical protein